MNENSQDQDQEQIFKDEPRYNKRIRIEKYFVKIL